MTIIPEEPNLKYVINHIKITYKNIEIYDFKYFLEHLTTRFLRDKMNIHRRSYDNSYINNQNKEIYIKYRNIFKNLLLKNARDENSAIKISGKHIHFNHNL